MMSLAAGANCSTFPEHELDQNHAGRRNVFLLIGVDCTVSQLIHELTFPRLLMHCVICVFTSLQSEGLKKHIS